MQTKRQFMSSMPATTEALRTKYEVLTNLWLLAQSRHPGPKMYADFTENTWPKFLKELLNEDNFGLQRDIQGEVRDSLPGVRVPTQEGSIDSKKGSRSKELSGLRMQILNTG